MTNHDQFNELLDHALTEYRDAEPLAGLEDRVLQRLQSQTVERRSPRWIWGAIATCAALILIGVWIGVENSTTPQLPTAGKYGPPTTQETEAQKPVAPPPAAGSRQGFAPQEHLTRLLNKSEKQVPRGLKSARDDQDEGLNGTAEAVPFQNVASQFPTPAPLTAEEHALLALLHASPDALPKPRENSDDATIAPLEIKPLAGSAAPTQENSNE